MAQITSLGYGVLSWMDRHNPHSYNETLAKQQVILDKVVQSYLQRSEGSKVPLLGEFVEMPDGSYLRVCSAWKNYTTTTVDCVQLIPDGSFFDNGDGQSYSGALWPSVNVYRLTATEEKREGAFWFFADGWPGSDRGVYCRMDYRVWKLVIAEGLSSYYKDYIEDYNAEKVQTNG